MKNSSKRSIIVMTALATMCLNASAAEATRLKPTECKLLFLSMSATGNPARVTYHVSIRGCTISNTSTACLTGVRQIGGGSKTVNVQRANYLSIIRTAENNSLNNNYANVNNKTCYWQ